MDDFETAGFMKTGPIVYTLLMHSIYVFLLIHRQLMEPFSGNTRQSNIDFFSATDIAISNNTE